MFAKLSLGLIISVIASSTFAQTNIQSVTNSSAYVQDSRGVIVRNSFGLCWRTGYWTPADAVIGCDGELAPPIAKLIAPPIATTTVTPAVPAEIKPTTSERCDFAVTLQNDEAFAFNKTVLSNAAKKRIDTDVFNKLSACKKVDLITVTGHTDRLGSQQYNQKLSEKRANAVAAYLKGKGASVPIEIYGAGETQPVNQSCNDKLSRKELIACLAPNRRVTLEIRGIAK